MNHPTPTYWSDAPVTVHCRGVTLRLEAGDPRVAFMELLLFGQTLPQPFPPPPAEPVKSAPPVADVEVPAAWVTFWNSLLDLHRRALVTLAQDEFTAPRFEKRLNLPKEGLRTVNIVVAHRARKAGIALPVEGIGRGRDARRYFVKNEARPWVLELERRWVKAQATMTGGARQSEG